jgi:ATP-dependent helicase Lhr and Lhr-like helicase
MCALDEWTVDDLPRSCAGAPLRRAVRRAARNVLDLLAGRYPSDEFAELRPRIVWDRVADVRCAPATPSASPSPAAAPSPTAACSACSCPTGPRVGELDEEMVYESRPARRSCSARPPGASRTSPSTGSSSPRPRASRARCRSGTATPGRPLELGRASARSSASSAAAPDAALRAAARTLRLDELGAATWSPTSPSSAEATGARARRPHDRRRALPRRDRRLAGVHPLAVRRPGPRPVGDGDRAPAPRAARPRRRDDVERRRHRRPAARGVADGARSRSPAHRPRRDRRARRVALPQTALFAARFRECAAGRCCCRAAGPTSAPRCGSSASGPPTCSPWRRSTRRSRSCSRPYRECLHDVFDVPALREVLTRVAVARDPGGPRRHRSASPFPVAAVRLDRRVHVRGRRAAGRAPGRGARARPRPAARAARRRGAARAARPRRAGRPRARAAAPHRRPPARATPTSCTTCCAGSATSPAEVAACAPRPDGPADGRRLARRAGRRRAPGDRGRRGRRGALDRRRGRRPATATRWGARSRSGAAGRVHRTGRPPARRAGRPLRPHPRPVPADARWPPLGTPRRAGRGRARALAPTPPGARRVPARRARSASGATPTCCASCAAGRWPRCGARSSRSSPRRSPASSRWHGIGAAGGARRARRGARDARRARRSRVHARARRAARRGSPATAGRPRRAVHERRGRLGGRRRDRARDGRIRLCFADQLAALAPRSAPSRPTARLHDARSARCSPRGASFWGSSARPTRSPPTRSCSTALWDLVWAGEVTNDSLAPLRAVLGRWRCRRRSVRAVGRAGRPRPGRLTRLGPPAGPVAGAWSRRCSTAADAHRAAHAQALQLLERTASSPARRSTPRASPAGSPPSTACSRCSRSEGRRGAATSSPASARPSSPARRRRPAAQRA